MRLLTRLKRRPNYYNFQRRTVGTFFDDVATNGIKSTVTDRLEWARMRMDPSDIADVTGSTYTFLMNGFAPDANWTALFQPGERCGCASSMPAQAPISICVSPVSP